MNAHAWVEAYLAPELLPERLPAGFDRTNGAWMIIDPTAAMSSAPAMNASSYIYEALRQFVSSMRAGWRNYVLGLTYARQKEVIYQPVWAAVTSTATALTHREFWETLGARLAQAVSPTYWGLANGGWFSWRGALATIVIMLFFVGVFYAGRSFVRRIWRWTSGNAAVAAADNNDVEFYRRLEALLAERRADARRARRSVNLPWPWGGNSPSPPTPSGPRRLPANSSSCFTAFASAVGPWTARKSPR